MAEINKVRISRKKLDQVQQILSVGEFFLKYSKKYWKLYQVNKEKDSSVLIAITMQSQMFFRESLLNLTTLLSKNTKEASIDSLLNKEVRDSELYKQLNLIRKDFSDSKLKDIRNKIIAHKQRNKIRDPIVNYLNRFHNDWYTKLENIYKQIHEYLYRNFDVSIGNEMEDLYEKSFDYLYKKLEKDKILTN
jgi:hypothetical protein